LPAPFKQRTDNGKERTLKVEPIMPRRFKQWVLLHEQLVAISIAKFPEREQATQAFVRWTFANIDATQVAEEVQRALKTIRILNQDRGL